MGKNVTIIIIVLVVLWQVIYGLIQKAAKQQQ